MKIFLVASVLLIGLTSEAYGQNEPLQNEENWSWETIDSRPNPGWWSEAKFGIFIHWGPYSVPAFNKKGEYAEWYWKGLADEKMSTHSAIKKYHNEVYGDDFSYFDFAPLFKAELFNPQAWAKTFKDSGAKYVVLTSKHHDGFTLWPNEQANNAYNRPWNAVEIGPKRDVLGELSDAVRAEDLKMGIYYSLYEWFNPLYLRNMDSFVEQHFIPQFKEVVEKYKPSVIFSDGEWEHPAERWKARQVLQWLYSQSSVKNEVVVNDRWGKDTRHKHGGYYTTEYGSGLNAGVPWEENRGIGHSYGYNKNEALDDYNSGQNLTLMLIDIVSRGGNFLLNVGPTAEGTIPVIMEERLQEIGQWLSANGNAIFGTTVWERPCQWSDGTRPSEVRGEYKIEYNIEKLTLKPDPGYAVKEIFFTKKDSILYCIFPQWPQEKLIIKDLNLRPSAQLKILGVNKNCSWENKGSDVYVTLPSVSPSEFKSNFAFTLEIAGY